MMMMMIRRIGLILWTVRLTEGWSHVGRRTALSNLPQLQRRWFFLRPSSSSPSALRQHFIPSNNKLFSTTIRTEAVAGPTATTTTSTSRPEKTTPSPHSSSGSAAQEHIPPHPHGETWSNVTTQVLENCWKTDSWDVNPNQNPAMDTILQGLQSPAPPAVFVLQRALQRFAHLSTDDILRQLHHLPKQKYQFAYRRERIPPDHPNNTHHETTRLPRHRPGIDWTVLPPSGSAPPGWQIVVVQDDTSSVLPPPTLAQLAHSILDHVVTPAAHSSADDAWIQQKVQQFQTRFALTLGTDLRGRTAADVALTLALAGVVLGDHDDMYHRLADVARFELVRLRHRTSSARPIVHVVERFAAAGVVAPALSTTAAQQCVALQHARYDHIRQALLRNSASTSPTFFFSDRPLLWLWRSATRQPKLVPNTAVQDDSQENDRHATAVLTTTNEDQQCWWNAYADPTRPLVLDLGCGLGVSMLRLASLATSNDTTTTTTQVSLDWDQCNYLGADLSLMGVRFGRGMAKRWNLEDRLQYTWSSVSNVLNQVANGSYPGTVALILIQFPSPYRLKSSNAGNTQLPSTIHKGFMVSPSVMEQIVSILQESQGQLVLQSNCEDVGVTLLDMAQSAGLVPVPATEPVLSTQDLPPRMPQRTKEWIAMGGTRAIGPTWSRQPVIPSRTETEAACHVQDTPVHRCLLRPPPRIGRRNTSISHATRGPAAGSRIFSSQIRTRPPRGSSTALFAETTSSRPEEAPPATLEPFGVGVKRDILNRIPDYPSDIADGLNAQSLATTLFLFFACLAPAIGFGSVLGAATDGQMGVIEMVASTSLSGVLYAVMSAQPVQLIGPQGPVIAYIAALYQLSKMIQVPFLPFYACTGLWTSGFLALFALYSASNLVEKLTRFTDETFSVLVSTLFLMQAVTDVTKTFAAGSPGALTSLLTVACCSLTFGTATVLKGMPRTRYMTASIRKNLANFAPAVGVIAGSLVARAARINWGSIGVLPGLQLPTQFATSTGRKWLVTGATLEAKLPSSAVWFAAVPAFLAAILLYLDQNITARLVNHPRFKQVKGKRSTVIDGLNGDMLALSFITGIASVIGMPWMCGAPTRSAAHVRALSKLDDNGDIIGTVENRVSGFSIHALIGLCAIASGPRQLLAQVPLPVLSGVFLYLGFTSLQGLEFWDRVKGLFKDVLDSRFMNIPRRVISAFTIVQMASVAAMMKVTQSKFGVLSPVLIAFLPLVRWGMLKVGMVPKNDMEVLDS